MVSSFNTYNNLDESLKLQRSQSFRNDISSNLYAALMMTREDSSKRESANNARVKNLLVSDSNEQLSEAYKEKIWYTLDFLRIKGIKSDIFKNFKPGDFDEIKNHTSTSDKVDALVQLIIKKAGESLSIKKNEMNNFKTDIDDHVNAMIKGRNAEIGNKIAEEISLTMYTTKRARYYGKRIQNVVDKNRNSNGSINWENCYMTVIKYANYASLPPRKRAGTRYIVPMKFGWRNTINQVKNTLDALKKKSEESTDKKEKFAINSIIKNLQPAFEYYIDKNRVSNKFFNDIRNINERGIYDSYKSAA